MMVGGGTGPATNFTRQDVQRPRPPHVAVMSTPAAWAAARMEAPGARAKARRADGSRGLVRMVREAATSLDSTPAACRRARRPGILAGGKCSSRRRRARNVGAAGGEAQA